MFRTSQTKGALAAQWHSGWAGWTPWHLVRKVYPSPCVETEQCEDEKVRWMAEKVGMYPLVNVYMTMENHHC